MREFLFFFLYGMLTATGLFLSVFWGRLTFKRYRALEKGTRRQDRYLILAGGLAMNSIGSVVLFGGRLYGNYIHGLSQIMYGLDGFMIGLGLSIVLLAKVLMVWLADLEAEDRKWLWGMGAITIVWTVAAAMIAASMENGYAGT